jgi:hypothetical protein
VFHEYQAKASRQDVAGLLAVVPFACAHTMAQLVRYTHVNTQERHYFKKQLFFALGKFAITSPSCLGTSVTP